MSKPPSRKIGSEKNRQTHSPQPSSRAHRGTPCRLSRVGKRAPSRGAFSRTDGYRPQRRFSHWQGATPSDVTVVTVTTPTGAPPYADNSIGKVDRSISRELIIEHHGSAGASPTVSVSY